MFIDGLVCPDILFVNEVTDNLYEICENVLSNLQKGFLARPLQPSMGDILESVISDDMKSINETFRRLQNEWLTRMGSGTRQYRGEMDSLSFCNTNIKISAGTDVQYLLLRKKIITTILILKFLMQIYANSDNRMYKLKNYLDTLMIYLNQLVPIEDDPSIEYKGAVSVSKPDDKQVIDVVGVKTSNQRRRFNWF